MDVVKSKNGVSIRLPEARWFRITEEHSEMAGYYFEVIETVEQPQAIYQGTAGECLAVREVETGIIPCGRIQRDQQNGWIHHNRVFDKTKKAI
jgi:hypothetical protein